MSFTIFVDADSCPALVRKHIISFCEKQSKYANALFVSNRAIPLPALPKNAQIHICPQIEQAADDYIFEHAQAHDAVITRDIPFAARLTKRDIICMNDRGTLFTKENIRERLSERDFNLNLVALGLGGSSKKSSYGQKEFKKFCDCFEREMQKLLIIAQYGPPRM